EALFGGGWCFCPAAVGWFVVLGSLFTRVVKGVLGVLELFAGAGNGVLGVWELVSSAGNGVSGVWELVSSAGNGVFGVWELVSSAFGPGEDAGQGCRSKWRRQVMPVGEGDGFHVTHVRPLLRGAFRG